MMKTKMKTLLKQKNSRMAQRSSSSKKKDSMDKKVIMRIMRITIMMVRTYLDKKYCNSRQDSRLILDKEKNKKKETMKLTVMSQLTILHKTLGNQQSKYRVKMTITEMKVRLKTLINMLEERLFILNLLQLPTIEQVLRSLMMVLIYLDNRITLMSRTTATIAALTIRNNLLIKGCSQWNSNSKTRT